MKNSETAVAAALTLTVLLTGCSGAGAEARELAERWLAGDTSVQCVAAPSTWSDWELGNVQTLGIVDGSERWAVEISGRRGMAIEDGGHLLVDTRDGRSCVRWYERPEE